MFGGVLEEKKRGTGEEEVEEEDWSLKRSKKVEGLQECGRRLRREEMEEMIGVMGEKVMRKISDEMGKMRGVTAKGGEMEEGKEDTGDGREAREKD
ncbi:hypothetical protein RF55_13341 [Lasius niger]|uniref:Uncharacterized protein n=1 Tax=Lasius niger TaxID=67767 RepID=A0A0J7KAS5_LASNI|nr:hypothetical protein RF55_13341 [Lasius niger]